MSERVIAYMLTCGPLVLTLCAWLKLYCARHRQWPHSVALAALGIVSANAILAFGTFLHFDSRHSHPLPSWEDLDVLTLGLLLLLAPVGMIFGFFAALRGAPKWLIGVIEIASVPLLVIGVMANAAT